MLMAGYLQEPSETEDPEEEFNRASMDRAVALALAHCPDGEGISIHHADCPIQEPPHDCLCIPTFLRKGASA